VSIESYFDTSVLLKLYKRENGSIAAFERASRASSLPLTFLGEIELRNSLQVLTGRDEILPGELAKMLREIDADIAAGRIYRLQQDPATFESIALELLTNFAAQLLCRSLDILHVAHALAADIPTFVTCDKRQSVLAGKAGLEVDFIDLSQIA
jgi:predicted nucleic acid-binding protein